MDRWTEVMKGRALCSKVVSVQLKVVSTDIGRVEDGIIFG